MRTDTPMGALSNIAGDTGMSQKSTVSAAETATRAAPSLSPSRELFLKLQIGDASFLNCFGDRGLLVGRIDARDHLGRRGAQLGYDPGHILGWGRGCGLLSFMGHGMD